MIPQCLIRKLWTPDLRCEYSDGGDLENLEDREHAELELLYRILLKALRCPNLASRINRDFVISIADNMCSVDAMERRCSSSFVAGYLRRNPFETDRVALHLVAKVREMSESVPPPGIATILGLLGNLTRNPRRLVVEVVLPLLGLRGFRYIAGVLWPIMAEPSSDLAFRELVLDRLLRRFPVSDHGSRLIFLDMIQQLAVGVQSRLLRRLLMTVVKCIVGDDIDGTARALATMTSPELAFAIDTMTAEEAAPLLEMLLEGAAKRPRNRVVQDALSFIRTRHRSLVREAQKRFADQAEVKINDEDAETRRRWTAALGEDPAVALPAFVSTPAIWLKVALS